MSAQPEADSAVGLRFSGDSLPGLVAGVSEELPCVEVRRAPEAELKERWALAARTPRLRLARSYADGTPFLRIESDALAGYRIWAHGYGTHLVDVAGSHCASALPEGPAWRGLRLLASQTMPLIATLRGREVMHAAGVVIGAKLVGLVASSGTGKSSTACHLVARGARFFADDVLALELAGGHVRAHPGPRLVNVHASDLDAIPPERRSRVGTLLDESDKLHLEPPGHPASLPLGGLVFLSRRRSTPRTSVAPLANAPVRLLGNAFVRYLDEPERLVRQLEVASTLARTVPLAAVEVGSDDGPDEVAGWVERWVREELV